MHPSLSFTRRMRLSRSLSLQHGRQISFANQRVGCGTIGRDHGRPKHSISFTTEGRCWAPTVFIWSMILLLRRFCEGLILAKYVETSKTLRVT